jgi:hypothetical protein
VKFAAGTSNRGAGTKAIASVLSTLQCMISVCGMQTVLREKALARDCVRIALSFSLILLSLPLLAISLVVAAICAALVTVSTSLFGSPSPSAYDPHGLLIVDEFGFDHALKAYTDLIEMHCEPRAGTSR